jgi:hypothetical protein
MTRIECLEGLEARSPKAEIRKKAEDRNPKKPLANPGMPRFRVMNLAGKGLKGDSIPPTGRRLFPSAFGFRI